MKRREPVKRLETPSITPERARELVDIIAGQFADEITGTLIELIAGIIDLDKPGRDERRLERSDARLYVHDRLLQHLLRLRGSRKGREAALTVEGDSTVAEIGGL